MSLKAGAVLDLPDLACIGMVKNVGEAYLSDKGVYHVLPVEVEGKYGARDTIFFFLFQPRWFERDFDPKKLLDEKEGGKLYGTYRRMINDEARPAALVSIAGEEFDDLVAAFDAITTEVKPEDVERILREKLLGRDVGYILVQRVDKDEDGKKTLTEQYNVGRFFPMTDEEIAAVVKQANSGRRRKPLVVTWDEN